MKTTTNTSSRTELLARAHAFDAKGTVDAAHAAYNAQWVEKLEDDELLEYVLEEEADEVAA